MMWAFFEDIGNWLLTGAPEETPTAGRLAGLEVQWSGGLPLGLALGLLLLLSAAAVWCYAREPARLRRGRRVLLAGLRLTLLSLLVLLLLRPVLLIQWQGWRPRPIVLLLDNSQSMQQRDRRLTLEERLRVALAYGLVPPGTRPAGTRMPALPADLPAQPSRLELVKAVLADRQRQWLPRLQARGPLRACLFGNTLRMAFEESGAGNSQGGFLDRLLGAFQGNEPHTALADALAELLHSNSAVLPAAVVLITDGQDNASKTPLEEVAREYGRLGVPLHIWGVGATHGGLLQLSDVQTPDTFFAGDSVTVPLRWRARGLKGGTVQLRLYLDGRLVAEQELPLQLGEDLRAALSFTPDLPVPQKPEKHRLTARIRLKDNPAFQDQQERTIYLSDHRAKVLYLEGAPRWQYRFLQTALLRDRRVAPHFLLLEADPRVLQAGPPFLSELPRREQLLHYDVILLGDVPASRLGKAWLEELREYVRDFQGGLALLAGRAALPAHYGGTPLAELFPVDWAEPLPVVAPEVRPPAFRPQRTTLGEQTPWLALAETPAEDARIWAHLPPFYWTCPGVKLRPGAVALLVHPSQQVGEQPVPILALHSYGRGQVLFLGSDETWRWRYNQEDKYFARFWGQLVYQLALPHLLAGSVRRFQAALERGEAILDRPGMVFVRLLTDDLRPRQEKQVLARLRWCEAPPGTEAERTVTLLPIPGRPGEYRALLPHDHPGRYELRIAGQEESFVFRVTPPPQHELEEAGLAEEALRQAAALSGGRFYREEDLDELPEALQPQTASWSERRDYLLWNPLAFFLGVALLTAEWVLRKWSNLS